MLSSKAIAVFVRFLITSSRFVGHSLCTRHLRMRSEARFVLLPMGRVHAAVPDRQALVSGESGGGRGAVTITIRLL